METTAIKCPSCGANLNIEAGREKVFCSYCGNQVMLKESTSNTQKSSIINYHKIAKAAYESDKYKEAQDYYKKILEFDSSNIEAWLGMGKIAQDMDDLKAAVNYFIKAVELDNTNPEALFGLACSYGGKSGGNYTYFNMLLFYEQAVAYAHPTREKYIINKAIKNILNSMDNWGGDYSRDLSKQLRDCTPTEEYNKFVNEMIRIKEEIILSYKKAFETIETIRLSDANNNELISLITDDCSDSITKLIKLIEENHSGEFNEKDINTIIEIYQQNLKYYKNIIDTENRQIKIKESKKPEFRLKTPVGKLDSTGVVLYIIAILFFLLVIYGAIYVIKIFF